MTLPSFKTQLCGQHPDETNQSWKSEGKVETDLIINRMLRFLLVKKSYLFDRLLKVKTIQNKSYHVILFITKI